jgi:signal transduction histidine kinase/ActR/RegA family two-component response regulator
MIIPLFFGNEFWGLLSFDDLHKEHTFNEEEVNILHSASLIIVSAIERARSEDMLNIALNDAIKASQAKSLFLSNMSHEMRTPMNAIIGMSTIGQNAENIEKKDESFAKIKEASNHLLGVINDVLDMSKIEANKLELNEVEFDFIKMLQSVINVVGFRVKESKQNLEFNIDPDVPRILIGDNQRLSQVLTNLLSNAVKFTPEGGSVSLEVEKIEEGDGDVTLRVSVVDTGIGISAEQQSRLFNSFEQADSGTSRKFGGTGLGLAISKRIVEIMGGRIWVESKLGEGSKFSFEVTIGLGNQADAAFLDKSISTSEEEEVPDLSDKVIMVAEDIDINREIVTALLEPTGVKIENATNGREAFEMFKADPRQFDLILMDVQMPEMDGFEATRSIRSMDNDWAKKIPIIAMTANVFREDIEKCLAAGMVDHIGKPIDIDIVMSVLQKYLA